MKVRFFRSMTVLGALTMRLLMFMRGALRLRVWRWLS